ncbi:hypothetical protein QQ045_029214 [Rhodiola kirilowii]
MKQKQQIPQMMSQPLPQMMSQPLPQMMNQPPHSQMMRQPMPPNMNRSYGLWPRPPPVNPAMDPMIFKNHFTGMKPPRVGRSNWKGQKGMDKKNDLIIMRNEQHQVPPNNNNFGSQILPNMGGGVYQPPTLLELQSQNRNKARKYYNPTRKFNNRFAPYAPRNTSSFIIRAKKSGGIASLVSPCPVTPAVLPTPVFSPSRELLGDTANEEWGVDGYGSMKGLIRLRSPGNNPDGDDEDEDEDGSSESDVEEHVEVERRLDHDLSRFEMIYPNDAGGDYNNLLENRVDDQDTHIAQLEEENLTLKERLFLMEREMSNLRRRLQSLEKLFCVPGAAAEEVLENGFDNDAESSGRGEDPQHGVGFNEELEYVDENVRDGHDYQKENIKAFAQAVLENEDEQILNDTVELDIKKMEKKDAKHMNVSGNKIMEQAIGEGAIKKKVVGSANVENTNVVGAEKSGEHKN